MKSIKQLGYVLMVLALMVIATGCGGGKNNTDSDDGNSGSLVVSGSSAMQPLIAAAAEEFMAENPNADIQVNAGGSGTGLSQVSEGSVDIGNSDVYAEEKEGIDAAKLVDHKVAVVGIAAAINSNVGITDISKEDLIKVFTGKITNWKDVGGKDQKIVLVNRPDSSGTRAVFNKFGLDGATPAEGITEDSSNTVKKILKETEGAVGYLAFSYFTDDSVKALSVDGVEAKEENVQTGKFPIWAYQHSYTKGEATGLGKSFLDYVMSDDIQSTLLKEQGYLPVTEMKVERDAEGNLKNL
ncbi:phosphate ABC transporter substrate-binding protein [Niallia taxi]|uniref:phosphate ABC transporter substrate-binding protein n=1 Tax=Niallia taxi TaxID=2499688 RepID=UPI00254D0140|nr:phosphate ABC transporter substrate-binding protein [Niallia taxi]MDK8641639.1 phosphate ABC transporter substrate-binding protein [Niallia taxi]